LVFLLCFFSVNIILGQGYFGIWKKKEKSYWRVGCLPVAKHLISGQRSMRLAISFTMVRLVQPSHHGETLTMFFLTPLFLSLQHWKTCYPCKKIKKSVLFVSFIIFDPHSFNCIKYLFFFNFIIWYLIFISNLFFYFMMFRVWPSIFWFLI